MACASPRGLHSTVKSAIYLTGRMGGGFGLDCYADFGCGGACGGDESRSEGGGFRLSAIAI